MDSFSRLIVGVLLMWAMSAHAALITYKIPNRSGTGFIEALSAQSACSQVVGEYGSQYGLENVVEGDQTFTCWFGPGSYSRQGAKIYGSCPLGSVSFNGECRSTTCTGGQHFDSSTGTCVSTCNPGDKYGPSFTDVGARCVQTSKGPCMAMPTVISSSKGTSYRYVGTGDLCSGSESPASEEKGDDKKSESCTDLTCPPKSDGSCASGYSGGSVNGTSLCVKNTTDTKTTTESSTDGSSSSTQKQTSCQGDTCTTTTTTSKDDGTGSTKTTTSTTTQSKDGYCTENPSSPACKDDETTWGGACASGFICKGDAIQCAMAREQHIRNCTMFEDKSSAVVKAGEKAANGEAQPEGHPAKDPTEINFSGASINQTNPYGSSCPADIVVSAMGRSATVPLADICPYLRIAGYCLVALSLWFAFKTVSEAL